MVESVLYHLRDLNDHNLISVYKKQFKIGRTTTNDLAIENNPYISSCHCIIEFDNGHVYIRDTSSNGTLINRSKKINRNDSPVELYSGDIVHLVFRKDELTSNVIYQLDLPPMTTLTSQTEQNLKRKLSHTLSDSSIALNETKLNTDLSDLTSTTTDDELKRIKTNNELAGDDMEDILTCVCCQDIMTNPICLEPCLHAFCSDCYASWEAVQRTCPKCRIKVVDKKKNVVINGILEAFLKAYPHKRSMLKVIDNSKSKIRTTAKLKNEIDSRTISHNNNNQYNDYKEEMDNDSIDDDDDYVPVTAAPCSGVRLICRQCPSNCDVDTSTIYSSTEFRCRLGQNHILCQCCAYSMPDRRNEPGIHQSCEICHQYFCNIYFEQCQREDCLGCLNQLQNFNFASRHLTNFVNGNFVETQIVQNYLTAHNATMRDLLIECCRRLDRKEFTCTGIDTNRAAPSSTIVCYQCGLTIFKQLTYQFRAAMKQNDIVPITMRNRENCYYGKQCRTQYNKPSHAQKLNHACEQTRF